MMFSSTFFIASLVAGAFAIPSPAAIPKARALSLNPPVTANVSAVNQAAYLASHNTLRAKHNATELVWNQTIADLGASWASKCNFQHSGGTLGRLGENLAAGIRQNATQAVQMWIDEEKDYNRNSPQYSHYTQMVWKGTKVCALVTSFPAERVLMGLFYCSKSDAQ
jgi:uncharacterized protein YkwD